jgi:hypothetical protein
MKRIHRLLSGAALVVFTAFPLQSARTAPFIDSQYNDTSTAFFPLNTTNDLVLTGASTLSSVTSSGPIFLGELGNINNGLLGGATTETTDVATDALYFANGGPAAAGSITFHLNTAINTQGYDISALNVFGGWNQKAILQIFTVSYTKVGNSSPITLTNVNYVPFAYPVGAGDYSSLTTIISDNASPLISGVDSITFSFEPYDFSGDIRTTMLREISVIGTASVPEPSTMAIITLAGGVLFVMVMRRRTARAA